MNLLCDSGEVTLPLWAVTSFLKWLWHLFTLTPCASTSVDSSQYNLRKQGRCEERGWGVSFLEEKRGLKGKWVTHSKDVTCLGAVPNTYIFLYWSHLSLPSQPPC